MATETNNHFAEETVMSTTQEERTSYDYLAQTLYVCRGELGAAMFGEEAILPKVSQAIADWLGDERGADDTVYVPNLFDWL